MSRHEERIARVRHAFRAEGLDALLVASDANVTYLSGFTGDSTWLLVGPDRAWLITDGRYTEQAAAEAPHCEVERQTTSLDKKTAETLAASGAKSLGFSPADLTVAAYGKLVEALDGVVPVEAKDLVEKLRRVKDEDEIARIRAAAQVADAAFEAIRGRIAAGQTEAEVAADLEHEMRRLGARKASFDTIVAARHRSSLPHAQPTVEPIAPGDPVLIDWGALRGLYCSDCTRMLFLTAPNARWREVYAAVLGGQRCGLEAVRPGAELREVDAAARTHIADAGFGDAFSHGLGHGVGLRVHEGPGLSTRAEGTLEEGMVVTIEPGIYLPGWGGVRIEDLVVVRKDGPEILSSLPKDLEAAILC